MEVHHHHSHEAHKKFRHYLYEFFMLFLAVTAGFLVENFREKLTEHGREKEYIVSMVDDLNTDSAKISNSSIWFENIIKACDTLLNNYDLFIGKYSPETSNSLKYIISGFPDFVSTDRTMQQLKNAGGLRLIRNTLASDSIIGYDMNIRDAAIEESEVDIFYDEVQNFAIENFNYRKLDKVSGNMDVIEMDAADFWIKNDIAAKEKFYNLIRKYRSLMYHYNKYLERVKNRAIRLATLLRREYRLSSE